MFTLKTVERLWKKMKMTQEMEKYFMLMDWKKCW